MCCMRHTFFFVKIDIAWLNKADKYLLLVFMRRLNKLQTYNENTKKNQYLGCQLYLVNSYQ